MEGEIDKLVRMEDLLHKRVVGQDEAVRAVAERAPPLARRAVGPEPAHRLVPVPRARPASGKTELARALAEFLFDDDKAMVRIDMSEYMEKFAVSRLVGAPPGYVGYEEGGQLTEAVRRRPYAVVLLDEIEKAHPDVFNVLLQVLEDGRLTDGQGRTVDFTNAVLIMTSNLSVDPATFFRPEFLNRIDEIVTFRSLTEEDLEVIVGHPARAGCAPGSPSGASPWRSPSRPRRGSPKRGYDPDLRRAAAAPGDPAPCRGPARPRAARGPLPGGRDGRRRRDRRRARVAVSRVT